MSATDAQTLARLARVALAEGGSGSGAHYMSKKAARPLINAGLVAISKTAPAFVGEYGVVLTAKGRAALKDGAL